MLNPNGAETPQPSEDGTPRARPAPRPLEIDPSWKAGRKLEEARRQLGLTYEQISARIRVRREFLEALETMNAKLLPGKAYALAYLRSYARLLGLDEQAIVEQFQDEVALSREDALPQIRSPESRPHRERPWLFAVALVAIAAGFVGLRAWQDTQAPPPAEESAALGANAPAEAGAAARQRQIEIRAVAPSWLEIRGPDGTVFLSREMQPGDTYSPDASAGWTMHARDGGAFELTVDGQPAGLMGIAGQPVLGRQLDDIRPLPAPPVVIRPAAAAAGSPPAARTPAPQAAPAPAAVTAAPSPPAEPAGPQEPAEPAQPAG